MTRSTVAIILTSLLLAGCGRQQASSPPDLGGPSGSITWIAHDRQNPVPGIDQGSVWHAGIAFVAWGDFLAGSGGSWSGNVQGIKGQGRLIGRDNRLVEFDFETKDGKTGTVTMNQVKYELVDGGLFLVSTQGDKVQVKQLKRDMKNLKFERDSLEAFARNDAEIAAFFGRKAKKD